MKIIRFSAIWCAACLVMRPRWSEAFKDYSLLITDYDYDLNPDEVSQYNIGKTIPVVIFIDENNQEISRIIGEKSKKELMESINRVVGEGR